MVRTICREIEKELNKIEIPLLHQENNWIELLSNSDNINMSKGENEIIDLEEERFKNKKLWRKYNLQKQSI